MSNIKYTYIPLDKATIIDRRHQREVQPPGMVNLENFIPARSDESPTLRPDIVATQDEIYSISDVLSLPTGNTMRDLLNAANGLYGSSQVTFFTRYVPYGNDNGTWRVLSGTHGDGTISGASGGSSVSGSGTLFLEKAHRGSIMKIDGSYDDTYNGGFYTWEPSTLGGGVYYLTDSTGADPAFLGNQISRVYYYGNTHPTSALIPGQAASLGQEEASFDDQDTLGFNTIYIRNDSVDPDFDAAGDGHLIGIYTDINISGSTYQWVASGSGTNEYYYQTRAGGDPQISGDEDDDYGTTPRRLYNNFGGRSQAITTGYYQYVDYITKGTAGSLSQLEYDLADNDALGYTTYYVRSDNGNP